MRIEYHISGVLDLPEGSVFSKDLLNHIILPDGEVMSVHPVIELNSAIDADDHIDITQRQAEQRGILWLDYDRTIEEVTSEEPLCLTSHPSS